MLQSTFISLLGSCALTKLNSKKKTIHLARVASKLRTLFYQTSNTVPNTNHNEQ